MRVFPGKPRIGRNSDTGKTCRCSHVVIACSESPDFGDVRYSFGKRQGLKVGTIPHDVQRTSISATGASDDLFLAKKRPSVNGTLQSWFNTCLPITIVYQRSVQYWTNIFPCVQDLQKTSFIKYDQALTLSELCLV